MRAPYEARLGFSLLIEGLWPTGKSKGRPSVAQEPCEPCHRANEVSDPNT